MKQDRPASLRPWRSWLAMAALSLLLYHLAWPLVFQVVILPEAQTGRQGFLVEEFGNIEPSGQPLSTRFHPSTRLGLANPDTSLRAFALWRVDSPGFYRLRLECDDYGSLSLDGRALISMEQATTALNQGEARVFLQTGPHLLVARLSNGPGRGWLAIKVATAGGEPQDLPLAAIGFIDLGNVGAWLKAVAIAQWVCLACLLAALLALLRLALIKSLPPRPGQAPHKPGGGRLDRLRGLLWPGHGSLPRALPPGLGPALCLALLGACLALPSGPRHWFDGLPWSNGPEVMAALVLIPLLLLLDRGFLRRRLSLALLLGLLIAKLILAVWAPASGWTLRAYATPKALAAGAWEPTFESLWQPRGSGRLQGPLWEGGDLPLAWQARKRISQPERIGEPMILEVEGYARLPQGAGLALAAGGASRGSFTATDEQGTAWELPVAPGLAELPGADSGVWPRGKVRVRAVIAYDSRPWQDWSLIPALVGPGGGVSPLKDNGVLWQGRQGLDMSSSSLGLFSVLARLFDGGLLLFLAGWGIWAIGSVQNRGIASPALLTGSALGLALPWILRGLGLDLNTALILGLGAPLGAWIWLAARNARLAGAWSPDLGRLMLLGVGPGLLGFFLISWWPQAGQATLLSYGDDFGVYQLYAHKMVVEGDWWLRYMQFLHFQPLYPYIAALLHVLFGQSMLAQGLLDVWAALGAAALLPVLTHRLGGSVAWGLAAALFYLAAELGPDFTWHIGRGLQEHTAMLLLMLTAFAVSTAKGAWASAWTAGALAMLTYLLRQDYLGALAGLGLLAVSTRPGNGGRSWSGLLRGALAGWRWLLIYYLAILSGALMVLLRNKFIGGRFVLTNPGHIDHLLGTTNWLHSMAVILCMVPTPVYHSYVALVLMPGTALGLAAIFWRRWPLAGYPLALGLTLAGLLAPYLILAPYAYEPRMSVHLLPLAALSLALGVQGARPAGRQA